MTKQSQIFQSIIRPKRTLEPLGGPICGFFSAAGFCARRERRIGSFSRQSRGTNFISFNLVRNSRARRRAVRGRFGNSKLEIQPNGARIERISRTAAASPSARTMVAFLRVVFGLECAKKRETRFKLFPSVASLSQCARRVVVGHSMGGVAAAIAAAEGDIDDVVLVAPAVIAASARAAFSAFRSLRSLDVKSGFASAFPLDASATLAIGDMSVDARSRTLQTRQCQPRRLCLYVVMSLAELDALRAAYPTAEEWMLEGVCASLSALRGDRAAVEETLESFRETLSVSERNAIRAFQTEAEKEDAFRRHWSCKEALVKAMGVGLGMELGRASFSFKKQHEHAYDAVVEVDGEPKTKWRFRTERVFGSSDAFGCFGDVTSGSNEHSREYKNENAHWITTARGPTEDVTDAFGAFINTWRAPDAGREDDATWRAVVDAPAPPFSLIEVGDLVPRECIDAFRRAGGEAR